MTAWIVTFCLLGAYVQLAEYYGGDRPYVLSEQDRCVQTMARSAVDRSLSVIGHGVKVSSVSVQPIKAFVAAQYYSQTDNIEFNLELEWSADEILHTAGHESVHAIFDHAGLNPYSSSPAWDSRLLVEEVAAEVLGAHIAGRIRTRQGGDGEALTQMIVAHYRQRCSWSPGGVRRRVWRFAAHLGAERINHEYAYSIALHYGPPEMVDAIDQICRDNPDVWVAALLVAERFIEPIDEPVVPEEG